MTLAFLASIVIHAILFSAVLWRWSKTLIPPPQPRERVLVSTAIRIEKRPVPQAPSRTSPARQHTATAAPKELARIVPLASPMPRRPEPSPSAETFDQQLARQEASFSQEVARLNQHQSPLSLASSQPKPPAAFRRTYFDFPGHSERNEVIALLIPLRHWRAQGLSCYYVRYVAQYTAGGNEEGVIPWPVCYPAGDDAMARPAYPHDLPIPYPQRDYVLPPGTYLAPLLQSVYGRRPNP